MPVFGQWNPLGVEGNLPTLRHIYPQIVQWVNDVGLVTLRVQQVEYLANLFGYTLVKKEASVCKLGYHTWLCPDQDGNVKEGELCQCGRLSFDSVRGPQEMPDEPCSACADIGCQGDCPQMIPFYKDGEHGPFYKDGTTLDQIIRDGWSRDFEDWQIQDEARAQGYEVSLGQVHNACMMLDADYQYHLEQERLSKANPFQGED